MRFSWIIIMVLVVGCSISSNQSQKVVRASFKFNEPPYLSPLLIRELQTSIADFPDHAQVVALDVAECQDSNRFFGEVKVRVEKDGESPIVYGEHEIEGTNQNEYFSYQWLGATSKGIHVLLTKDSGGGTMVDTGIMLVEFAEDAAYSHTNGKLERNRGRILIRRVGEFPLGDRYSGVVRMIGDELHISKDAGSHANLVKEDVVIEVR